MPGSQTARRRVAVVLDGPPSPRWQQRALERLEARAELEVGEVRLLAPARRSGLRERHAALERRLFAAGPDASAPVLVAARGEAAGSEPELVVWLAEQAPGEGGGAPVLCLRHDGRPEGAEQAFRRAVLRGHPSVRTAAVLCARGGERVIDTTVSGARPYSVTVSRDKALWKLAELIPRAAARAVEQPVAAAAAGGVEQSVLPAAAAGGVEQPVLAGDAAGAVGEPAGGADGGAAPSTAELLVRSPWRWLRIVAGRALFDRPWQVRIREAQPDPVSGWSAGRGTPVAWRARHLYADPFLFEHEGRHHLFCEEIAAGSHTGVISHVELGAGGRCGPPEPVLAEPHHLSYPFVFAHGGEVFMIPETSSQRRVCLYRAVEFPHRWEQEAVLLDDLTASDATLLAHEGALWLFVGVAAPHATMLDELHLYSSAELTGEWKPHPLNPIVSDVRCARPAGAIQRWGSALVRPAQDCSRRYGGAVTFRQIDVLSADGYAEHEIARIDPADLGGGARAVHTYASDGAYEAVDLRERSLRSAHDALRIARRAASRARRR